VQDKIIIIGYSGHAFVVIESALKQGIKVEYYCEQKENAVNPFNLIFLGDESSAHYDYWEESNRYILGIGNNIVRGKIAKMLRSKSQNVINVIDPNSDISSRAIIGNGNYIAKHVAINAFVKIGNDCIINTGAIVEHECILGNAIHIAPGAVLAGNVQVGNNTFIGANSVVKQGVCIGENVIIGAGTVILKDVPSNTTIVGNPGKII